MDFRETTVVELARRVRAKEISAKELTNASLVRIEELNGQVGAFVALDQKRAIEQAEAVDQVISAGNDPGPLAGIPFGVKDSEDALGYRTTCGSTLLAECEPAKRDSVQVGRLRAAGAIVVGKTNLPEFAWSANTTNALFGTTANPWNLDHSPGGSSGGSAAALASGMVPLATGSDGGGSIRIPSAACGFSGMKPSLGRVPSRGREGAGWLDFSTKGPMALRISDIATALDVVVGPDASDLHSLPRPEANWRSVLDDPRIPIKVAWSPTLGYAPLDAVVQKRCETALGVLATLGAEIIEVDSIFDSDPVEKWLTYIGACALRTLDPFREDPGWDKVDPMLAFIAQAAREVSALELVKIFDECHRMNQKLVSLFHDVRLLVTPVTAALPPPNALGGSALINGVVDPNWVRFTYPFNMTRSPAATVCTGLAPTGLPVGIQLIGPQHGDLVVLRSAAALEAAIGFKTTAPI